MKVNKLIIVILSVVVGGLLSTSCYTQLAISKHNDAYYEDEYVGQTQDSVYYEEGTTVNNYYYYGRPDRFLIRHGFFYDDPFYQDDFYFGGSFYFGNYYDYPYWYDPFLYYPGIVIGIYYPPYYRYYDPWWSAPPVVYSPPFKHRPFRQNGRTLVNSDTRRISLNKRDATSSGSNGAMRTAVRRNAGTDDHWSGTNLVTRSVRNSKSSRRVDIKDNGNRKNNSVVRVKTGAYQQKHFKRQARKDSRFQQNKSNKRRRIYHPVYRTQPVQRLHPVQQRRTVVKSKPVKASPSVRSHSKSKTVIKPSNSGSGSSYKSRAVHRPSLRSTPSHSSSSSRSKSSSGSRRASRSSSRRR